jgi:hypothetical protein
MGIVMAKQLFYIFTDAEPHPPLDVAGSIQVQRKDNPRSFGWAGAIWIKPTDERATRAEWRDATRPDRRLASLDTARYCIASEVVDGKDFDEFLAGAGYERTPIKQVFYIYADDKQHEPPADTADLPVEKDGVTAYAGATSSPKFGGRDITANMDARREYCLAWGEVNSEASLNEWFTRQGWTWVETKEGADDLLSP